MIKKRHWAPAGSSEGPIILSIRTSSLSHLFPLNFLSLWLCSYVIHLDGDAAVTAREVEAEVFRYFDDNMQSLLRRHNVFLFSRHCVQWGSVSIVEAELDVREKNIAAQLSLPNWPD